MREFSPVIYQLEDGRELTIRADELDGSRVSVIVGDDGAHDLSFSMDSASFLARALATWIVFEKEPVSCPRCLDFFPRLSHPGCSVCEDGFVPRHDARGLEAEGVDRADF